MTSSHLSGGLLTAQLQINSFYSFVNIFKFKKSIDLFQVGFLTLPGPTDAGRSCPSKNFPAWRSLLETLNIAVLSSRRFHVCLSADVGKSLKEQTLTEF